MRTVVFVVVIMTMPLLAACGSSSDSQGSADEPTPTVDPAPAATTAESPAPTETPSVAPASNTTCDEPDGQEKASLRFAVRAHDRELKDSPWALVRKGDQNYMAAEIEGDGPRLVVLVSFPEEGAYLSGMKAVNGTARTFTDLPEAGNTIPTAGERALDCVS